MPTQALAATGMPLKTSIQCSLSASHIEIDSSLELKATEPTNPDRLIFRQAKDGDVDASFCLPEYPIAAWGNKAHDLIQVLSDVEAKLK